MGPHSTFYAQQIRILLVEDDENDAVLLELALKRSGKTPFITRVQTPEEFQSQLQKENWDIVLSDFYLPKFSGVDALQIVKQHSMDVPFIIVSGQKGEEFAVEAIRRGADDYIPKSRLERLAGAIERAQKDLLLKRQARQNQRIYQAIGESIDYGVWLTDSQGRVTYASDSFLKLLGTTLEQFADEGWINFIDPNFAEASMNAWKQCVQSGANWEFEFLFHGKDDSWHPILSRGIPLRDDRGNITAWAGINLDISKIKQSEAELRKAKEEAILANRAKSDFLANMSHELRTPMNGIIGVIDLLALTELTPTQKSYLDIVLSSSQNLLAVISDILDFSKIEKGKIQLSMSQVNIRTIIHQKAAIYAAVTSKTKVIFESYIASDVPETIFADELRTHQILDNLLNNATKFTRVGKISLSVSLHINEQNETFVKFVVQDTGIGIPADKLDQIFSSFYQVDSSITKSYGGSGLGLTIARSLVSEMGGTLWAESKVGVGSQFSFTLPVNEKNIQNSSYREL